MFEPLFVRLWIIEIIFRTLVSIIGRLNAKVAISVYGDFLHFTTKFCRCEIP